MVGSVVRIAGLAQFEFRQHSMLRIETHVHGQRFAQAAQRDKGSRDGDATERDLCRQQDIAKRPAASGAEDWIPPLLMASFGSVLNICRSGITPNTTPASTEISNAIRINDGCGSTRGTSSGSR